MKTIYCILCKGTIAQTSTNINAVFSIVSERQIYFSLLTLKYYYMIMVSV